MSISFRAKHPLTGQQFKGGGCPAKVWVLSLLAPGADAVPTTRQEEPGLEMGGGKEITNYPMNGSACFKVKAVH